MLNFVLSIFCFNFSKISKGVIDFLGKPLLTINDYSITWFHILGVTIIFIACWVILLVIKRLIKRQINKKIIDAGRGKGFYQIIKYILVVIAILLVLDTVGVKITILLAGSAALLVGVGFGIQQVFNDLISGVILLFEGSVTIDDIIEVDGLIGRVVEINLRTSNIETQGSISIIIPNSKLVSDNVINWSHNRNSTRFDITVGVAYGSDTRIVERLLIESIINHKLVENTPKPLVRFQDFGDSSLVFKALFWSNHMFEIENIKSDIRFSIDEAFRKNNVIIPFPQRDLHLKSSDISLK